MKALHVIDKIDKSYEWGFEELLYNYGKFQSINNDLPQQSFYLVNKEKHLILGHVSFELLEGNAISHHTAPFGGFNFSSFLNQEEQLFFAIEVERLLQEKGVNAIVVHQPPFPHVESKGLLERLPYLGFEIIKKREYQMLSLSHPFNDGLHDMEKRKLKKAEEKGLRFDWAPESKLKEVLDFVIEQRTILGYEFSMEWSRLKEYQKSFPQHYLGARIWDEDKLIAASILVKENENVLYQFAPAHLKTYNKYSPVVYMTAQVAKWAASKGFYWLNLGTSYLENEKNESLYKFKENLGAKTFVASSLQKVITS